MVDILSTICAAVGRSSPKGPGYLGRDLGPILRGASQADWRKHLFTEHTFHTEVSFRPQRAATESRYKLIRSFGADPRDVREELYDTAADPDERHDLANRPEQRATQERLSSLVRQWQIDTGDPLLDPRTFAQWSRIPARPQDRVPPWYAPVARK